MLKKFSLLAVLLLFIGGSIIMAQSARAKRASPPAKKPIVVGWVVSLSGPLCASGVDMHKILLPLTKMKNKEGGIAGHPVKLIVIDAESNATKAVLAAKRLIQRDKVHMLGGDIVTGVTIPVGSVASENKIAHLAWSGSPAFDMQMKKAGKEVYHWNFALHSPSLQELGAPMLNFVKSRGQRFAMIGPDSAYGKTVAALMMHLSAKFGVEVAATVFYPVDATTFGPQIAKIKATPYLGTILMIGAEPAAGLCTAAVREAGITKPIVVTYQAATTSILGIPRVREGYATEPPVYVLATAPDCWETLPKDDPRRVLIEKWSKLREKMTGTKITNVSDSYGFGIYATIEDIWSRLLKDKPDILDQDLATIRSAVRDYTETIKDLNQGCNIRTMSPQDHAGGILGTAYMMSRFKYPPPHTYVPGFEAAPPPRLK